MEEYHSNMTVRAIVFGVALAATEPVRRFFALGQRKAAVYVLQDVECPPCFYIRIDDQVFAVRSDAPAIRWATPSGPDS